MKHTLLAAALAAIGLVLGAAGASAFTAVTINKDGTASTAGSDPSPTPNLAVPNDVLDHLTTQTSPDGTKAMQFGNFRLEMSMSPSGSSGAANSPFLTNPATRLVPSLQYH
jgi:hypothetical protein